MKGILELEATTRGSIMRQYLNIIILLSFCLVLSGCFYLTRSDISTNPVYQDTIGSSYVTKTKMKIYGAWISNEPQIYGYFLTALPGIGGSEIKDIGSLPAGTILKITKVIKRTPSITLDNDGILFIAEIISPSEFFRLEVNIYSAFGTYKKSATPRKYVLSDEHFTQIERTKQ